MNSIPQKQSILLVLTYGMNLRDVVLNTVLWNYLTQSYSVEVWTPLAIENPQGLGIARVLNFSSAPRWSPKGIWQRVRGQLLAAVQQMKFCDFYMFSGQSYILNWNYAYAFNLPEKKKKWWFFYQFIYHAPGGKWIYDAAMSLVSRHPLRKQIKARNYRFVFVTHPRENNNQIASIVANSLGCPVVLAPLGLDNLTHGGTPIVESRLALLWGEEQLSEYRNILAKFNPKLRNTVVKAIGSLVYDNYLGADENLDFYTEHNIAPDEEFLIFAAHVERYYPNQLDQAAWFVEYIRSRQLRVRLVIRVRPGFDEEMWTAFAERNRDVVSVQIPKGVSYDKSGLRHQFRISEERHEVAVFATMFKKARLLVAAALSTTYTDAQLLGTPAVALLCDPENESTLFTRTKFHKHYFTEYPYYADYNVAHNREEVFAFLDRLFSSHRPQSLISEEIFRMQAVDRTASAGRRAIDALEGMFPTQQNRNRVKSAIQPNGLGKLEAAVSE